MRAFTIRSSDVARCPIRSLSPSHYRIDGSCKCLPPPGIDYPTLMWRLAHCDECGCAHAEPRPDCRCVCHEPEGDG